MKKLRWQLIIIFLTGLVVGILLIGEQPTATPFAPEPAQGGVYAEALVGSLQRLNPLLDFYNPADRDVDRLIFSGLLRYDDRGIPQPDLAESWGVSKDGTVYNFTLRKGILWQDGEPLTTDDVLFTVDMIKQGEGIVPADLIAFWQNVEIIRLSEDTLQFRLPEAFSPFPDYLTFGVLPQHLLGGISFAEMVEAPFNLQPVGSGPYKFSSLMVENGQINGVVLNVFADYYGKKPYIEQIVMRYYPDGASAFKAYDDKLVQGVGTITFDMLNSALSQPDLSLYTGRKPELAMVFLNLNNSEVSFLQDVAVRKALFKGINRQWIVDRLMGGQAVLANGVVMPGTWAYYDGLETTEYGLEEAAQILKEAGYVLADEIATVRKKEDVALSLQLLYPDDDFHKAQAEAIQRDWMMLNIGVEIVPVPYEELINVRLYERNYQAALVDINFSRSPDPDPYPFWDQSQATGGQNYSQWENKTASEYLEAARVSVDRDERMRLYRNFQVMFADEMPSLPLYYPVYTYGVDKQVQGVSMGPLYDTSDRFATLQDWFLVTRRAVKATQAP